MAYKQIVALMITGLVFSLGVFADPTQPLTVGEAYQAIPHQQTRFDPLSTALMDGEEKQFLDLFFGLTDLALVERVSVQLAKAQGAEVGDHYADILERLQALHVPAKLALAHHLVIAAVTDQQASLQSWNGISTFNAQDPLVESAHQKLLQAYSELMRLYPQENAHTKQAFFDHLCGLDFK
ncbi:MAG: hypothetical protein PHU14_01925 [Methylovulum sp.]|nr:hypothetical protein [Methylovulum sp.]